MVDRAISKAKPYQDKSNEIINGLSRKNNELSKQLIQVEVIDILYTLIHG